MAELAQHAPSFNDKNVCLAVIGSGEPHHFKEFREVTGYGGLLFSDPSLKTFAFLGFSSSLAGFMSIKSVVKAFSALKNGHRQGAVQGSTMQLGGAVVIDPSGSVRYFFAGKRAGDHPDMGDLIRVVED